MEIHKSKKSLQNFFAAHLPKNVGIQEKFLKEFIIYTAVLFLLNWLASI